MELIKTSHILVMGVVAILLAANYVPNSTAQYATSSSSCVNRLIPCLNYLNTSGDLPDSCCDPLKSVIKSDAQCLCRMISTQGTFQAQLLGINISQVEMLPARCGQRVNPIACITAGSSSSGNSVQNSAGVCLFPTLLGLASGGALLMMIIFIV